MSYKTGNKTLKIVTKLNVLCNTPKKKRYEQDF